MYERKPWEIPTQYNDEPEIPARGPVQDDTPIDYSKGPDRGLVFGDDDEYPEEEIGS